ncbi:glycine--tRNA ligase subunit beta [bacterium]|nr:glycine--tRNA ligase subunit beta [bacterium]
MEKKDALLEIGCEELPVDYIQPALLHMVKNIKDKLTTARLDYSEVVCEATSRRLVLMIRDLDTAQETIQKEVLGPKKAVAFKEDGSLSPAGQGFLRKVGLGPDDIAWKDDRLFACVKEPGQPGTEILASLFFKVIKEIPFPKSMRWEASGARFARPIRWILALQGRTVIPVSFADVASGNRTMLHPLHSVQWAQVEDVKTYFKTLAQGIVTLSVAERKKQLKTALDKAAKDCGGRLVEDNELLEMVTMMCEHSGVLAGTISERFMQMPREIITTAMREHQRYFAVENNQGKLLPSFLAVHDNPIAKVDTIRPGCEKVLLARLKDAEFFYQEDMKIKLEALVPKLERVRWVKGLGTLLDKTERLKTVCGFLAEKLEPGVKESAGQAAQLSKADLITNMVQEKEFNSLQGVMGMFYALEQGIPQDVAASLGEQYLPRWAGDRLPQTSAGKILALADRFDHVVGCWGAGFSPTGAKDPYALRRAAQGIIAISLDAGYRYSILEALYYSIKQYPSLAERAEELAQEISRFVQGRMETVLGNRGILPDLIQAVLGVWWDDLTELVKRAEAIHLLRKEAGFTENIITFSRVVNILPKDTERRIAPDEPELEVQAVLLTDEDEKVLYTVYKNMGQEIAVYSRSGDFVAAFRKLSEMKPQVDSFFDKVMVMDKNSEVRRNRLNLLTNLARTIWRLADFSKLVVTE